ncbi:MAG TPA: alpha-E domain-containing protein [Spirochaetia bacterium]|nr:alpha-E domain-containing protein [Spirochaetia bacterium]
MGIVSVTKGGALYWLGRYAQRTIILSTEVYQTFDHDRTYSMISSLQNAYDNVLVLRDLLPLECFASFRSGYSMLDSLEQPDLFRIRAVVEYLYAFWGAFEDTGDETEVALAHFGRLVERLDLALQLGHDTGQQRAWKARLHRLSSVLAVDVPAERIPDAETPEERAEALLSVNRLFQEAYTHGS